LSRRTLSLPRAPGKPRGIRTRWSMPVSHRRISSPSNVKIFSIPYFDGRRMNARERSRRNVCLKNIDSLESILLASTCRYDSSSNFHSFNDRRRRPWHIRLPPFILLYCGMLLSSPKIAATFQLYESLSSTSTMSIGNGYNGGRTRVVS
jgi:hypothetical protein